MQGMQRLSVVEDKKRIVSRWQARRHTIAALARRVVDNSNCPMSAPLFGATHICEVARQKQAAVRAGFVDDRFSTAVLRGRHIHPRH